MTFDVLSKQSFTAPPLDYGRFAPDARGPGFTGEAIRSRGAALSLSNGGGPEYEVANHIKSQTSNLKHDFGDRPFLQRIRRVVHLGKAL